MFGVGLPELMLIALIAVCLLGPDRVPELAKQAGQMMRSVRKLAQSTRDELRDELGPEYADLRLRDLDPRTIVRKHILEAMDDSEEQHADSRNGDRVLDPGEVPPHDLEAT